LLGWEGPFVLAVDDTKLTPALRSYNDAGDWTLIGMHGKVKKFDSYEELIKKGNAVEKDMIAEKVRNCWFHHFHSHSNHSDRSVYGFS
jgi:hypothetical protein